MSSHAQIYEECVPCGGIRPFFVTGGHKQCSNCGWIPTKDPAPKAKRSPGPGDDFDQRPYRECPYCKRNRLFDATGDGSYLVCRNCGWEGDLKAVKHEENRENSARDCFFEDTKRGTKGGGSKSGKARKKPPKRGGDKALRDINDDAGVKITELLRGTRKHVMNLPDLEEPAFLIRDAIFEKMLEELADA